MPPVMVVFKFAKETEKAYNYIRNCFLVTLYALYTDIFMCSFLIQKKGGT